MATRWSSASLPGAPSDPLPTDPDWAGGGLYVDSRTLICDVPADALWRVIEGIGGENGWYSLPVAWRLRGALDRIMGGVGLRRGGAIRDGCGSGTPSTSGASKNSNLAACYACAPRCGYPAWPGWN